MHKHVTYILNLAKEKGWNIFPRNGLLLGIVRHESFLPNEDIDADLGIISTDIIKVKEFMDSNPNGIGGYSFVCSPKQSISGDLGNTLWNNIHPITNEPLDNEIKVMYNKKHVLGIDPLFPFANNTKLFYPLWTLKGYNKLFNTWEALYCVTQGASIGPLTKDGQTPITIDHMKNANGNIVYCFEYDDFKKTISVPFYESTVPIPAGYENILVNFYGKTWKLQINRGKSWENIAENSLNKNEQHIGLKIFNSFILANYPESLTNPFVYTSRPLDIPLAKENLALFYDTVLKYNLNYRIVFGTLLGIYRDGGLIKHDTDIDVAIPENQLAVLTPTIQELCDKGFTVIRYINDCLVSISRGSVYIDIYIFVSLNDHYDCEKVGEGKPCKLAKEDFDKDNYIEFMGRKFKTVSNIERHLVCYYGKDWQTPRLYGEYTWEGNNA